MNANDCFNHPSVKRDGQRIYVNKADGIIELEQHDCACPPGTKGGLRLNSTATWAFVNDKWVKSDRSLFLILKWAIAADDTKMFLELLETV
jgi:hypothetical protein